MTKAEELGKEIEKRIEKEFKIFSDGDFWRENKHIYSALYDLVSYANNLEKKLTGQIDE